MKGADAASEAAVTQGKVGVARRSAVILTSLSSNSNQVLQSREGSGGSFSLLKTFYAGPSARRGSLSCVLTAAPLPLILSFTKTKLVFPLIPASAWYTAVTQMSTTS